MADCPYIAPCIFFNDRMANMADTAALMKLRYCRNDFTACARYRVVQALGKGTAPADLFPNRIERANELIRAGGR